MLCQACILCSPPEPVKAREDIFLYPDGTNDKVYLRHLAFCYDEAKIWPFLRTCTPNVHPNFNYRDEAILILCYILSHYVFVQIVVRQPSFFYIPTSRTKGVNVFSWQQQKTCQYK